MRVKTPENPGGGDPAGAESTPLPMDAGTGGLRPGPEFFSVFSILPDPTDQSCFIVRDKQDLFYWIV